MIWTILGSILIIILILGLLAVSAVAYMAISIVTALFGGYMDFKSGKH